MKILIAVLLLALPALCFWRAVAAWRRGRRGIAPLWAVLGLQPLVASVIGGWAGVSPLAVATAAAAGVLDCCVFVLAVRGRRRLMPPSSRPAAIL